MFISNVFWSGIEWWADGSFIFSCRFTPFHNQASLLSVFIYFFVFLIIVFPMRECLGEHSCMSSFPIAILNGTCFLSTGQLQVHTVYSEH